MKKKITKPLEVVDITTGEVLNIRNATDDQISKFLSTVHAQMTKLQKADKAIKGFIKSEKDLKFKPEPDKDGKETDTAYFGDWRLRKQYQTRFSEDLLMQRGTEFEIGMWKLLKKKYSVMTEIIKFG